MDCSKFRMTSDTTLLFSTGRIKDTSHRLNHCSFIEQWVQCQHTVEVKKRKCSVVQCSVMQFMQYDCSLLVVKRIRSTHLSFAYYALQFCVLHIVLCIIAVIFSYHTCYIHLQVKHRPRHRLCEHYIDQLLVYYS